MSKLQVSVGEKYHFLTIVEEIPPKTNYIRRFNCLCDCGKYVIVQLGNMRTGHTKSCGCHSIAQLSINKRTHGLSKSREYKSYHKMMERCYSKDDISYHNYGGRGIIVCERWLQSFENFIEDMGLKPTKRHSIERNNTNGNYEPDNCKWATKKEQNNNRTNNTKYEYNGEVLNQGQWAEKLGIPYSKIIWHINNGFSFKEIADYIINNGGNKIHLKPEHRKYYPRKNKLQNGNSKD